MSQKLKQKKLEMRDFQDFSVVVPNIVVGGEQDDISVLINNTVGKVEEIDDLVAGVFKEFNVKTLFDEPNVFDVFVLFL